MHIILRFELEQEMLAGELALDDLPEAWNARMAEYLGIDVPDDAQGVLQDVHWSGGAFGYFPTYSLGNVDLRAAVGEGCGRAARSRRAVRAGRVRRTAPDGSARTCTGTGASTRPKEMLERITGGGMDPAPYIRYLKSKIGEIYGLPVEAAAPA